MLCQITTVCSACLVVAVFADVTVDPETYLNHAMRRYEESIPRDGQTSTPVPFEVSLIQRSQDFQDPKNWTTASAMQLLHLMKNSKAGVAVQKVLGKLLAPFKSKTTNSNAKVGAKVGARGTGSSLQDNVLHFKDHLNASLPSADVSLDLVLNLLLPDKVADWLRSAESEVAMKKLKRILEQVAHQRNKRSMGYDETHVGTADRPGMSGRDGKRGWGGVQSDRRDGGRTGDWRAESGSDGHKGL